MDAYHVDIFEVLRNDHAILRSLFDQLSRTAGAEARIQRLDALELEFEVHSAAEEEVIYGRLQTIDSTEELASDAFEEHCAIRDGLDALRGVLEDAVVEGDEGAWSTVLADLRSTFDRHVAREHGAIFESMARVLRPEDLLELRDAFLRVRRQLKQDHAA